MNRRVSHLRKKSVKQLLSFLFEVSQKISRKMNRRKSNFCHSFSLFLNFWCFFFAISILFFLPPLSFSRLLCRNFQMIKKEKKLFSLSCFRFCCRWQDTKFKTVEFRDFSHRYVQWISDFPPTPALLFLLSSTITCLVNSNYEMRTEKEEEEGELSIKAVVISKAFFPLHPRLPLRSHGRKKEEEKLESKQGIFTWINHQCIDESLSLSCILSERKRVR